MLIFIVNPTAGNGYAAKAAEEIRQVLESRSIEHEMWMTERTGHAAELARKAACMEACTGIISVGGDGTAFDLIGELGDCDKPVGFIPAGTGNDFVKTIGIPRKPLEALEFILTHEPRPVDIGACNGRYFLNVSGVGFDVTVLDQTAAVKKYMRGLMPYLIGLLRTIGCFQPVKVQYEMDGQAGEQSVLILSIANGRFIGGGIPICPSAQVDDGMFDVILVDSVPRWKTPFYLPGLMMGRIEKFGITRHVRCKRIKLHSPGMRLQIDGEIFTMDDADFQLLPGHKLLYW